MDSFDWYDVKSLESVSEIKYVISETIGVKPNTEIANGIAVCLQQGRMFFESAINSPFEIRPLLTLYGIIGFSKGLALARSVKGIETLKSSHGLKDISQQKSKIYESILKIGKNGNFQQFNDVVSHTGEVSLLDDHNENYLLGKPYNKSDSILGIQVAFKEILSRLAHIRKYYKDTFKKKSKCINFELEYAKEPHTIYLNKSILTKLALFVDSNYLITDLDSLKKGIEELRTNYPFLKKWFFYDLRQHPDYGIEFVFYNIARKNFDEFGGRFISFDYERGYNIIQKRRPIDLGDADPFKQNVFHFYDIDYHLKKKRSKRKLENVIEINEVRNRKGEISTLNLEDILPPIINEGNQIEHKFLTIQPLEGIYLSQYSLQYMGMYLLSSLVRYRPQIWVNAITDRDDTLALTELFVNMTLKEFPKMIVDEIKRKPLTFEQENLDIPF